MVNKEYLAYVNNFIQSKEGVSKIVTSYDKERNVGRVDLRNLTVKTSKELLSKRFSDGSRCVLVVADSSGVAYLAAGVFPIRKKNNSYKNHSLVSEFTLSNSLLNYCIRMVGRFNGYDELTQDAVVGLYISGSYVKIRQIKNPFK